MIAIDATSLVDGPASFSVSIECIGDPKRILFKGCISTGYLDRSCFVLFRRDLTDFDLGQHEISTV